MVKRKTRSCGRGAGAKTGGLAVAALVLVLGGCSPVETYRHWSGIAANDPNPATTPNTKNLAAGDAAGYPNLATVPPPPTQAMTTAELDKLTQSLIADRTNARYTSEQLQPKFDEAAAPPPPPPAAPTPGTSAPAAPSTTAPGAAPSTATPGAAPSTAAPSAAAPGAAPSAAAAPPAGAAAASSTGPGGAAKGARKPNQPPEQGPMESNLQSPQIASLPQPGQFEPAPPPPRDLSMPAAPISGGAAGAGAHLPAPPAPSPLPAALGSAKFQPAPAPPNLPPPAPIRTATASGKPARPAPPAVAYTKVADIAFSGNATALSDADRQSLGNIVPRYRTKPGPVKVVGYAGVGTSAAQQLDSYHTALERAQAVAAALAKAGIPADRIAVEAAPAAGDAGQGRAEILFGQ
jgi:outer membrane protein OmpA-like peptidoglycan-associated protein